EKCLAAVNVIFAETPACLIAQRGVGRVCRSHVPERGGGQRIASGVARSPGRAARRRELHRRRGALPVRPGIPLAEGRLDPIIALLVLLVLLRSPKIVPSREMVLVLFVLLTHGFVPPNECMGGLINFIGQ